MLPTVILYTASLTSASFLWFGIFVITRRRIIPKTPWWQDSLIFTGVAAILIAWYLVGIGLETAAPTRETTLFWDRLTWWPAPIAIALWFRAVILLPGVRSDKPDTARFNLHQLSIFLLALALGIGLLGPTTNLLFRYPDTLFRAEPFPHYIVPATQLGFRLYLIFLIITLSLSTWLLWRRYLSGELDLSEKRSFLLQSIGNSILTFGAILAAASYSVAPSQLSQIISNIILVVGIVLNTRGIIGDKALFPGQTIRHNYKNSYRSVIIAIFLFLLVFHLAHWANGDQLALIVVPVIMLSVTVAFTSLQRTQQVLRRLTLHNWDNAFKLWLAQVQRQIQNAPDPDAALDIVQEELLTLPRQIDEAEVQALIQEEIDLIFRHKNFHKDHVLASSQLLTLFSVQQALIQFARENELLPNQLSDFEKARVLRHFLTKFVREQLCPSSGELPSQPPIDRWFEYKIIYCTYIENYSRQEVVAEIYELTGIRLAGMVNTGGRAYALHLGNARSHLAHLLWQNEIKTQKATRNKQN
ncbi:hypothetical protein MNBD_CHLOROFLEXI01-2231 [hydrothermal vent metagenome]|uniref:Histidine kinase N-terminal 7TM region domain-containing protein n=1 Tax=hydrothermal vent metagenome TaxID=652676 RepID=A0A3B0UUK3_9ZZZZ